MDRAHVRLPLLPDEPEPLARPRVRSECASVPRPCPFASCRYSLLVDIDPRGEVRETTLPEGSTACALDAADNGVQRLEVVAAALAIGTREGARIVERKALDVFTRRAAIAGVIDRMPSFYESIRREHPERSSAPGEPAEPDESAAAPIGITRDWRPFGSEDDDAVCRSVWTMVVKRRWTP